MTSRTTDLYLYSQYLTKYLKKPYTNVLLNFSHFEIITPSQFGFQPKKSTGHAILDLINKISTSRKVKDHCCAIFVDLAKAFDTVDHKILLGKLSRLGIRGPMLKWFESYLDSRYKCVSVGGKPYLLPYFLVYKGKKRQF